jgi:hypothetical protein
VTEVFGLVFVAWLVYVSDALWWVEPQRIVLSGREIGNMRAQLGPTHRIRHESGVFIPTLTPPFEHHFEVASGTGGREAATEQAIAKAAREAVAAARPLERLGALLWVYCFSVAPVVLIGLGLRRTWMPLVAVLFAGAAGILACYARCWRRLRPGDPGGWKSDAIPMILSPVAAICAGATLTRSACASFDGLAVVAALATRDDFLRIARLHYFAPEGGTEASNRRREIDLILQAKGLREAMFQPPPMTEAGMEGYCPRCHTQLLRADGDCPECPHVAIVPFGPVGGATLSGVSFGTFRSAAPR